MHPKLTDFGSCVLGAHFMSKPKPIQVKDLPGLFDYLAPESFTNTVTDKSDVFSFGLVLLYVVLRRHFSYLNLELNVEESIDKNIKGKFAPQCWQVFMDITQRCIKFEPDQRPTMGEIEFELEHALSLQEQADISNTDGGLGYLAPEQMMHTTTTVSDRSDVFSFGVVLLRAVLEKRFSTHYGGQD
ncbi:hypothetical protein Fmac_011081 [Flemingia macrophylla]|uniref:Protein kinase domain-containing protein n=1 Tax=Flemingia macrophylla TaxID=520843 RepID=A0ABD1MNJ7_9FABA